MTLKTEVCLHALTGRNQTAIDFFATSEYNKKVIKGKDESRLIGCGNTFYPYIAMNQFRVEQYPIIDIASKCLSECVEGYDEIWNLIYDTPFNVDGESILFGNEETECLTLIMLGFMEGVYRKEEIVNA